MTEGTCSRRSVRLRDVTEADLPVFFDQQLDPDANLMAAFGAKNPADRAAFEVHWAKILADETIFKKTILEGGEVVGNISSFVQFGEREVGYWLGSDFWGRGVATAALRLFLEEVTVRPLYARAAKDNAASLKVLESCGFALCGEDSGFSSARDYEVEECILELVTETRHEKGV